MESDHTRSYRTELGEDIKQLKQGLGQLRRLRYQTSLEPWNPSLRRKQNYHKHGHKKKIAPSPIKKIKGAPPNLASSPSVLNDERPVSDGNFDDLGQKISGETTSDEALEDLFQRRLHPTLMGSQDGHWRCIYNRELKCVSPSGCKVSDLS
ncbi:hypothetical protein CGLO_04676 [Colletotrichum gloeosporioides Cg-14]|uniref:Uncharacterized protein n=1 Tax=Colletotrichum gloeosporioides (strain Cg-14) TaxID=1237896 RepID=T0LUH0_COLGC|nr:hypothetical protein CGLO_04676 [Colletotrichum gloeosporioides Cg-14]